MDGTQIASIITAVSGLLLGLFSFFKYRPGQKETTQVDVAQSHLNIAQGTINLVTAELEEQFTRMSKEQKELRAEHAKEIAAERAVAREFRKELDGALAEVRELKAELRQAWDEVEACKKRCLRLETQLERQKKD